jgi:flagellar hook-length control protein FliK
MPVAFDNPTPASPATPAGGSAALAGAPGAAATSPPRFFALLTGMSVPMTLAPLDPAIAAGADASEIAEILDLTDTDGDGDTDGDAESAGEDESLLAALGLPVIPAMPPQRPQATEASSRSTTTAGASLFESALAQPGGDGALLDEARDALMGALATDALDGADSASTAANAPATSSTASTHLPTHLHALSAAHSHVAVDAPAARDIKAPVGSHAWPQQVGDEITWMAQQGREAASLRLTPENMGPLEVRIAVREGEASVWFGAHNADTRAALEQALPRLREMFASQGLALADAGVFKEAPSHQPRQQSLSSNVAGAESAPEAAATRAAVMSARLLDTYA